MSIDVFLPFVQNPLAIHYIHTIFIKINFQDLIPCVYAVALYNSPTGYTINGDAGLVDKS